MPRDIYWSKQYETLPSFDKYKEPTQEELYSQLMSSNPGDMNYTPANPVVKSPLPDLTAPKPELQAPMASGYGLGQELTVMPPATRSLAGEPQKTPTELKDYLMSKYYSDPEGTFRQREAGRKSALLGGLGTALNTFTKATTGFEADNAPYQQMALDADKYESQESKRQQSVRDYLKDKAEMALKGKNYDLQLQQLKSEEDYRNRMLGLKEKELGQKGPGAPVQSRLAALSGEEKKAIANQTEAITALNEMKSALDNGDNTFTLVGSNNYTIARDRFVDAISRLQSGGAIGTKEMEMYMGFVPKSTDSSEMQKLKLQKGMQQMENRLKIAGFSPTDFGLRTDLRTEDDIAAERRKAKMAEIEDQLKRMK